VGREGLASQRVKRGTQGLVVLGAVVAASIGAGGYWWQSIETPKVAAASPALRELSVNRRPLTGVTGPAPKEEVPAVAAIMRALQEPMSAVGASESTAVLSGDSGGGHEEIGRAFPVSQSVYDSCARTPLPSCTGGFKALAALAQEPRDPVWAPRLEAKIAEWLMSDDRHPEIRAIECRTTLCAYEVATRNVTFTGTSYEFLEANGVLTAAYIQDYSSWIYGFEKDPGGSTVNVDVRLLVRR
jgi:hypothetical protein